MMGLILCDNKRGAHGAWTVGREPGFGSNGKYPSTVPSELGPNGEVLG